MFAFLLCGLSILDLQSFKAKARFNDCCDQPRLLCVIAGGDYLVGQVATQTQLTGLALKMKNDRQMRKRSIFNVSCRSRGSEYTVTAGGDCTSICAPSLLVDGSLKTFCLTSPYMNTKKRDPLSGYMLGANITHCGESLLPWRTQQVLMNHPVISVGAITSNFPPRSPLTKHHQGKCTLKWDC